MYLYFCTMIVTFTKTYLRELYIDGKTSDKQHRYQPQIVKKYAKVINLLRQFDRNTPIANICNITELSNHYK